MNQFKLTRTHQLLIGIILIYCIVVALSNSAFFSLETFLGMIKTTSTTMILACAVLVVMISGGIDVSCTAVALFGGYASLKISVVYGIQSLPLMFLMAIVIGVILGFINGVLIHVLALNPFVVTLGTSNAFHGLMTLIVGAESIGTTKFPITFKEFGIYKFFPTVTEKGSTIGLSISFVPALFAVILTWFILRRTLLGKGIFAMGCSPKSAERAGFNLFRIRIFTFCYAGALAGIMGLMHISNYGLGNPTHLVGTEMSVIAAVVIGGTRVSGGEGTLFGTILGVIIMWLFDNTLVYLGLPSSWNDFFMGAVLIFSIVVTSYQQRMKNRKNLVFVE